MKIEKDNVKMTQIRWQIPIVLMISLMVSYFDRMNISFALPMIAKDYGWTVAETGKYGGLLMSVFFIGYGIATIFLSPLGERFGAKKSIITVVILFSVVTCLQAPFGMMLAALVVSCQRTLQGQQHLVLRYFCGHDPCPRGCRACL